MSSMFDRKKIIKRYKVVAYAMLAVGLVVLFKVAYIATAKRSYWMKVAATLKRDSVDVKPIRGNILSCDGRLMASSLPEYRMYMDFKAGGDENETRDSLWEAKVDSICMGLHEIFPEKSAAEFKKHLEEGRSRGSRHWPVWRRRVSYSTFSDVKKLPVFNLSANKGGFHFEKFNARQRPFGSLAKRTIGDLYGAKDTAQFGLELSYDSILRGKVGKINRQKVRNKFLDITVQDPVNGADIVTTIDVNIQDLAERSLVDELKLINGNVGVAVVMEVKTGDIKAIVNMAKCADGEYYEIKNSAVSDLLEPGSVFKTASLMVALDDGVVDTTYTVDTGSGIWDMYGAKMRDHNWHRGGYQVLTLPQTLEYSSNIGVSRIIDKYYGKNPEKFVQGLDRIGIREDLKLPIVGYAPPRIRMPKKNKRGQYVNWSKTALPWMSIGYETQVPPISTLTFYNAIANGGTMMRPRFVKAVMKDGQVIREFPPQVIKQRICKEKTLREITTILEHVVSQGLGKKAGSTSFKVAGKTGTAQISKGAAGYKSGTMNYLLSAQLRRLLPGRQPALQLHSVHTEARTSGLERLQRFGFPQHRRRNHGPEHKARRVRRPRLAVDINARREERRHVRGELRAHPPRHTYQQELGRRLFKGQPGVGRGRKTARRRGPEEGEGLLFGRRARREGHGSARRCVCA